MRHFFALLLILPITSASHAADRPNIVIILADDLGYGSLNSYGADEAHVRTPNIDQAVAHLQDAVGEWKAYSAVLSSQYETSLLARTHFLDWNSTLKEVENDVVTVKREGDFPEVRFTNLSDGDYLPAGTDLHIEVAAQDPDGLKEVKCYLNGLLLGAEKQSKDTFVWNSSSDEDFLKNVKTGWYHLEAVAVDSTGVSGRQVIEINVGNAPESSKNDWKNEVYIVILNEGLELHSDEHDEIKIKLPRLESWMAFNDEGQFVFRDEAADEVVWKTFSNDEPGPHWAEFRNGRLTTYRGEPGNREVLLWSSKAPQGNNKGPFKFGITRDKRVTVFQDLGDEIKIVWMSN